MLRDDGVEGGILLGGKGTSAQISFYLHHSHFLLHFHAASSVLRSEICSKTMLNIFLQGEKHLVLMFNTNHKIPEWTFPGKKFGACGFLFYFFLIISKSWLWINVLRFKPFELDWLRIRELHRRILNICTDHMKKWSSCITYLQNWNKKKFSEEIYLFSLN